MAIIQEEITIGANKFYKIYSDNGYMLKNNYNTILREFYNKNYVEDLNANYTEIIDLSIDITNDELILGIALIISNDIQDSVNELINALTQDVLELTSDVDTNTANINNLSTNVNSDINDLSANITVLSNDVRDLNLDNVLSYYNMKVSEKYEEIKNSTGNLESTNGFFICMSKLGIKNNSYKNKLKPLKILLNGNLTAYNNVKAILLNMDVNKKSDTLESYATNITASDANSIKEFTFNTNISKININDIYKVIFILSSSGTEININYKIFNCETDNVNYLNILNTRYRPILSVYFEELNDYILLNTAINDINIDSEDDYLTNKKFVLTSDNILSVKSKWDRTGYPLKLYPRFFKPINNKIKLNSLTLQCPVFADNKDIKLLLSVKKYVYENYKPEIATSINTVTLTGNELNITFEFENLELDVDTFYMFEHGKNIALNTIANSNGTSEDNMNCILLYNATLSDCNLPVLCADFNDNVSEFISDKSFNKEVSSIVENYLSGYIDNGDFSNTIENYLSDYIDKEGATEIIDLKVNERIVFISDDDYKALVDNNLLDPNIVYVLSTNIDSFDLCEKRIINVADGIEDSDAATISLLKLSTEILTLMITDLTNRLNALENN